MKDMQGFSVIRKWIRNMKEALKGNGDGFFVTVLITVIITAAIAIFTGIRVSDMEKTILRQKGELNAKESAMEYNRCLMTRVNTVTLVGCGVDSLLMNGADNGTIEKYLADYTEYILSAMDPDSTGLYGWINEAYLDGSGWVPDDDYVATERPWYLQTMTSDQKITFVEPYVDMQTHSVMMTVSELLSDGKSVLAMDVSLDPIQQIVETIASATEGGQAFVLDSNGVAVAHSSRDQLGLNYLEETESLGSAVARKILREGQMQFDLDTSAGRFSVRAHRLEGNWYSVSLINADIWYRPLYRGMIVFYAILLLVVILIAFIFLHVRAKNLALQMLHTRIDMEEKRGEELQALSESDRMTRLYDHVAGERRVEELLKKHEGGMFVELDVDHFKSINDTYGHQTGDRVICAIADSLRSTFRTNDITMRLGGDEFAVFAVGISEAERGKSILRRLFDRLERIQIPEMGEEKVCVSVGAVISSSEEPSSFQELYARVDAAMYESKRIQGNSITFVDQEA